ncbi:MAG: dinitrogenase iron-molybdenum cofactor biosynthesis protein [Clostridia bacterium]|nr:dinitrogenase iron-molybdenum cofactor biosynthesis protein [Clostridia bacterium]
MKIAVTYQNGQIFQHFGHTEQFKIYEINDGRVTASSIVDATGSGHGALAGFLKALGVDVLICGGIGGGAQAALRDAGIRLFGGASGDTDAAVNALLQGNLNFNPNVTCNHHGEHHHHEGHSCGSHGDAGHSCGSHGGADHSCGSHGCGNHSCEK